MPVRTTHSVRRFAGFLYGVGARLHRGWMKRSAPTRGRLACAVVSVGALTLGGAGKTPVAARLARGLSQRGYRVVLASRGYKGGARERVTVVSDGEHVFSTVEDAGDEALVLVAHAPGVPVLVGPDRRIVGHHAVSAFGAEILILDDGFQHHRLPRDLDIVCVDGVSKLGNGRVVPAGPLRESRAALSEANWLCLVDATNESAQDEREGGAGDGVAGPRLDEIMEAFAPSERLCANRSPVNLVSLGGEERRSLDWLAGRSVGLIAGIARPASLRRSLVGLGAKVAQERIFPDHHAYRAADLAKLDPGVDAWIVTEKDAFKILPTWTKAGSVWVLRIEAEIVDEAAVLDRLEEHLRDMGRLR